MVEEDGGEGAFMNELMLALLVDLTPAISKEEIRTRPGDWGWA